MAIAHVQTTGKVGDSVTSVTTDAITTTSGNLLHANLSHFGELSSFTDSKGNTWETANAGILDPSGGVGLQLYAKNCLGGSGHTFTLTLTASGFPTISITEISGVDSTAPLHQTAGVLTPNGTSHSSGNVTTTVPDCILVGLCATGEVTTYTNDGDYIERYNQATTVTAEGLITSTRLVNAIETNDFAPTTGSSAETVTQVAAYKISGDLPPTESDSIYTIRTVSAPSKWALGRA